MISNLKWNASLGLRFYNCGALSDATGGYTSEGHIQHSAPGVTAFNFCIVTFPYYLDVYSTTSIYEKYVLVQCPG